MQEFIKKLKAAIMAESYEDRAGRSVISVKSALDIVDRLAAEQALYSAEEIKKRLEGAKGACNHEPCEEVLECINQLAAEQEERHEAN